MAGEDTLKGNRFAVRWEGPVAVVSLPVEIDIANERQLDEELGAVLRAVPSVLVVDMSGTRFCDSSGVAALVRAWKRARVLEVAFRVAGPGDAVVRVLRVLGADRLLEICPSVDAALPEGSEAC